MNILVTGGCGFMGSHFIKLIHKKHEVVCVDKLTYAGNIDNLRGVLDWDDISERDIASLDQLFFKSVKPDVVVNFAAETHVDRSIRDPKAFLETDVMGLFNLVHCSMKAGVKKFVHVSTDEVYGSIDRASGDAVKIWESGGKQYKDYATEATETFPLNPTSPYSASKASADLLLQAYYKTYNFPVIIVRPCNNYGPNQYPEKLIPMAITRLLRGEKVLMHGEGKEIREWIYVGDCVKAIEKVVDGGQVGEVYNIGSGVRYDNRRVISEIVDLMEPGIDAAASGRWREFVEQTPNRPGNDQRYAINSSKFVEELLKAEGDRFYIHDFEESLRKTIAWYKENKDWWYEIDLDANIYADNEEYLR